MTTDDIAPQRWIEKDFDADGYFWLQLVGGIGYRDMFLTADDASSLTIKGIYTIVYLTLSILPSRDTFYHRDSVS